MKSALLQLESITKSFGAVRALREVSFDLQPGEVHALVGENGAGKSTLIKIVTGAHTPDGGTFAIDGKLVQGLTPASAHACGIAAIYQQPALFPDLSVAENIALGLERPGLGRRVRWPERKRQATKLLERVGASFGAEAEVRGLSMPEQQLVEIARALGAGARILIMDEPTASLTSREVDLLLAVVKELRAQGVGVIYISHRLEEVFAVADRVTVLRDGETVGTRSVSKVSPDAGKALGESELIRMMVGREIAAIFPPALNAPGEVMLALEHLGCRESGVSDVNLEVRRGEIVGLAGLVGAGRTELARIIFGITPADSGSMRLNGKALRIRQPREAVEAGIVYVPEDRRRHGVILDMTVAENVTMGIHPKIFRRGWLRFDEERGLAEGFIGDLAIKAPSSATRAGNLSGGNQQKVALARWLAAEPKVLVLDEPTQGVDVGAKSEIHRLIRKLAAEGLAVLMISSELPEILGMSDRIAVVREGTVKRVFEGRGADPHAILAAALGQEA
jgi:rhamnose transport system ATP-binding protein